MQIDFIEFYYVASHCNQVTKNSQQKHLFIGIIGCLSQFRNVRPLHLSVYKHKMHANRMPCKYLFHCLCFTVTLIEWNDKPTNERPAASLWTVLTILHIISRHSHCSFFQCTVHRQNQIDFPIQCVKVKCHTRIYFSNFCSYWSHTVL